MKELNKHTLIEALASLPEYEPPNSIWQAIDQELVLQKGIANLEEHEPPALVWDHIQNDLVLQKGIAELPMYEPPAMVWDKIAEQLPTAKPQRTGRVVSMQKWARYAAAAVILGAIMIFGLTQISQAPTNTDQLTYGTETMEDDLFKKDWNEDEDAFTYLLNMCKERVFACENPEFKTLKMELEELNDAKAMLEEAIGAYGTNVDLIAEMREIEFARTDIVKRMIETVQG